MGNPLVPLGNLLGLVFSPSGTAPQLKAFGPDTDIDIRLVPKGAGTVIIPAITVDSPLTISAVSGDLALILSSGPDADVPIGISPKGFADVMILAEDARPFAQQIAADLIATDTDVGLVVAGSGSTGMYPLEVLYGYNSTATYFNRYVTAGPPDAKTTLANGDTIVFDSEFAYTGAAFEQISTRGVVLRLGLSAGALVEYRAKDSVNGQFSSYLAFDGAMATTSLGRDEVGDTVTVNGDNLTVSGTLELLGVSPDPDVTVAMFTAGHKLTEVTGASATFTTADAKTVTVTRGIITSVI